MYILTLSCQDKPGIVAAVATCLSENDCNIEESAQFHDPYSGQFFMRIVFSTISGGAPAQFVDCFAAIASEKGMIWHVYNQATPLKTLVLVSKVSHCLNDILYRWRTKALNIDITGIASNHEVNRQLVEERGLSYHHLEGGKPEMESQIRKFADESGAELIVLARYMQILSPEMCKDYEGRIINIHHSFLPGFKGARPYEQAYKRGVKIIGATAHFATTDLDEGPIIEQNTIRIDHSYDPRKLQITGRDTESRVLSRAIELYSERRIFLHDGRTVIL